MLDVDILVINSGVVVDVGFNFVFDVIFLELVDEYVCFYVNIIVVRKEDEDNKMY